MGSLTGLLKRELLLVLTLGAIVIAVVVGVCLRYSTHVSPYAIYLISFPGELMFRLLKMMIAPLIVLSIISG